MTERLRPVLIVIAGPNGSGKTGKTYVEQRDVWSDALWRAATPRRTR